MTSLFCLFAHKHRHRFVCLLDWLLLTVILFQKKKEFIRIPFYLCPEVSPLHPHLLLLFPSSTVRVCVVVSKYRHHSRLPQIRLVWSERACATYKRDRVVRLFLSLLCLSVSVYLVGSIKRESKKRRKKKGKRKRISGWSRRSSHLYHVLLIITIAVRCLREMLC